MKWKKDHKIPNTKSKLTDAAISGKDYDDEDDCCDDYNSEGLEDEDHDGTMIHNPSNIMGYENNSNNGRKRRSNGEIIGNNLNTSVNNSNSNDLLALGNEHLNSMPKIRMNK